MQQLLTIQTSEQLKLFLNSTNIFQLTVQLSEFVIKTVFIESFLLIIVA